MRVPYEFVGWGQNWRSIMHHFHPGDITIVNLNPQVYANNVKMYRSTASYEVDQLLIALDPRYTKGADWPIANYVALYVRWMQDAHTELIAWMKQNEAITPNDFYADRYANPYWELVVD
jgi:hypothetical protein